jgi:hypothetical protein
MNEVNSSKKHSILVQVVFLIVGAVVTFITNYLMAYYWELPKGTVNIGNPIRIENNTHITITITNESKSVLDDLRFVLPADNTTFEYYTDTPITVESIPPQPNVNFEEIVLVVAGVEPLHRTQLTLVTPGDISNTEVRLSNAKAKDLSVVMGSHTLSRERLVSRRIFPAFMVYVVLYTIYLIIDEARRFKLLSRVERSAQKARQDMQIFEKKLEKQCAEINKTDVATKRIKLTLLRRLTEMERELSFWRNTIRKLVYKWGETESKRVEKLFSLVRATLKTYTTDRPYSKDLEERKTLEEELGILDKTSDPNILD